MCTSVVWVHYFASGCTLVWALAPPDCSCSCMLTSIFTFVSTQLIADIFTFVSTHLIADSFQHLKSRTFSSLTPFFTSTLSTLGTPHFRMKFRICLLMSVLVLRMDWGELSGDRGRALFPRLLSITGSVWNFFCAQVFHTLCHADVTRRPLLFLERKKENQFLMIC